jgi:hypothetical protein
MTNEEFYDFARPILSREAIEFFTKIRSEDFRADNIILRAISLDMVTTSIVSRTQHHEKSMKLFSSLSTVH